MANANYLSVVTGIMGAVVGGVLSGTQAARATRKLTKAYQEAADNMRKATEEHSGENLYQGMRRAGDDMAYRQAMASEQPFTQQTNPGQTNNAMGIAAQAAAMAGANANAAGVAGRGQGMSIEQGRRNALYEAEKLRNEQALKQAGIDFNVENQKVQSIMGGIAGGANALKNIAAGAWGKDNWGK